MLKVNNKGTWITLNLGHVLHSDFTIRVDLLTLDPWWLLKSQLHRACPNSKIESQEIEVKFVKNKQQGSAKALLTSFWCLYDHDFTLCPSFKYSNTLWYFRIQSKRWNYVKVFPSLPPQIKQRSFATSFFPIECRRVRTSDVELRDVSKFPVVTSESLLEISFCCFPKYIFCCSWT